MFAPEEIERAAHHVPERHRQEYARAQRPLVEPAEHPDAAPPPDLDDVVAEHLPDERCDAAAVGMEAVRADVEMEVAVVPGSSEAAHDRVALDDGHGVPCG